MTARGTPFGKGQSGNPAGRPRGARNRATTALQAILDGDAEVILRKATEMAQAGDPTALRLCLDRIIPARKDRHVTFDMPAITSRKDLPKATAALLEAVAAGDITPSEAADVAKTVDAHVRALSMAEVYERLEKLEEKPR